MFSQINRSRVAAFSFAIFFTVIVSALADHDGPHTVSGLSGTNLSGCPGTVSTLTATTTPHGVVTWFRNGSRLPEAQQAFNTVDVTREGTYEARLDGSLRSIDVVRFPADVQAHADNDLLVITEEPRLPALNPVIYSSSGPTADVGTDCEIEFNWFHWIELCPNMPEFLDIDTTLKVTAGTPSDVIRGGFFHCTLTGTVGGCPFSTSVGGKILGTNPSGELVKSAGNGVLSRIAEKESGCRQFEAPAEGGVGFCPLFGPDGDCGILQIPNPTDEEVWNWRANLQRGLEIFNEKLEAARRYPSRVSSSAGFAMLVTNFNQRRESLGLPHVTVTVPEFTTGNLDDDLRQLELDAIRGYNGWFGSDQFGFELHEYQLAMDTIEGVLRVSVDEETLLGTAVWQQVPTSARPSSPGNPNYVAEVLSFPGCGRKPVNTCDIEIQVNGTAKDEDDFVVVTGRNVPDRPHTPVTLKLNAPSTVSQTVQLSHKGAGNISFDNPTPALVGQVPLTVNMYGDSKSSGEKDTKIVVSVSGGDAACEKTEDLTVITGIKIRFEGQFLFIADQTRPLQPDFCGAGEVLWEATPLPCENLHTHTHQLIFEEGQMPAERWPLMSGKRNLIDVRVREVKSFQPKIDLDGRDDFLKSGTALQALDGSNGAIAHLIADNCDLKKEKDPFEPMFNFGYRLGESFSLQYYNTAAVPRPTPTARVWRYDPPDDELKTYFEAYREQDLNAISSYFSGVEVGCTSTGMNIRDFSLVSDPDDALLVCNQTINLRNLLVANAGVRSHFARSWANWVSRRLDLTPGPQFANSFIGRLFSDALRGHPSFGNTNTDDDKFAETFLQLSNYDWYTLMGVIEKGVAATPGGIDLRFKEYLITTSGCPKPPIQEDKNDHHPYDFPP